MIKLRLNRLEKDSSTTPLVIVRTKYNGGQVMGYRLNNDEQLMIQPTEDSETFRVRACAIAKAQVNGLSIIKAIYRDMPCQR